MGKSRKQKLPGLFIENGRLIFWGLLILIALTAFILTKPTLSQGQTGEKSKTGTVKTEDLAPWPRLFVDEDFIDFGEVPFGKPLTYTFYLKNLGVQPLTINGTPEVKTLEGC